MWLTIKLALGGIALCVAGATFVAAARGRSTALSIKIGSGPAECKVRFAGQLLSLPDDEDELIQALRQQRSKFRSIVILGGPAAEYRCIGHVVYVAQRGGFKKVRFRAQPLGQ